MTQTPLSPHDAKQYSPLSLAFLGDSVFDLFGNPIRGGHGKRGRPPFEWTVEKSNKVKLALARGWSNDRIANALAVSLATLKRYFRAELKERDMARDQLDLDRFTLAWEAAKGGNVGAMRQVDMPLCGIRWRKTHIGHEPRHNDQ